LSTYVALRLRKLPVVHWFLEPNFLLEPEQKIIVRTQHGCEIAKVLRALPEGREIQIPPEAFVKEIVRFVQPEDQKSLQEIAKKEAEAFCKARGMIAEHKLSMKLLKAEYLFDESRLIFYFKSETKVDFRELLKSLATTFKTRIELRQIGVRDETKLLGGIGCCGKEVCCAQFMASFYPVSTKMAKDQNLSLNPSKLSGVCGRLLCCLAHEHAYYASFHGKFPKIGADICVDSEKAKVLDINFLTQKLLIGHADRRKTFASLDVVKGKKDPVTGKNLWWVQEPGRPEPDLTVLTQPPLVAQPSVNKSKEGRKRDEKESPVPAQSGKNSIESTPEPEETSTLSGSDRNMLPDENSDESWDDGDGEDEAIVPAHDVDDASLPGDSEKPKT